MVRSSWRYGLRTDFSLSPSQANRLITGQVFDKMISFIDIIPYKVQGVGERIMAKTPAYIRINQPYWILNNIKVLVHWYSSRHAMVLDLDSRLFTVDGMSRCK